jgi:fructoselysine-6-P-deglycase FrlB-like protein
LLADILREIEEQPERLSTLAKEKGTGKLSAGSLLVGAGDSYIAAQCASLLSSYRCLALDPYVLISSPQLSAGRTVAFISVSGRTQSNTAAAKMVKGLASRTVAVTANPDSALAESTSETLVIPYPYKPRMPGTLSFTLSLVAALQLASVDCSCDFRALYEQAKSIPREFRFSNAGTTFFLGNHAAYDVALYAAAKMYEFFGGRAQAELLEEFSHLELFSLRKADAVNVFLHSDPSGIGPKLVSALRRKGYNAGLLGPSRSEGSSIIDAVFQDTFTVQLALVEKMKLGRSSVPYFMKSQEKLDVSDSMIY